MKQARQLSRCPLIMVNLAWILDVDSNNCTLKRFSKEEKKNFDKEK